MMALPGGPCHPWLFVEESAGREVERDFSSVYSRLVLCRTFRLDEDGKVLTPEEVRLISLIANTIVGPRREYLQFQFYHNVAKNLNCRKLLVISLMHTSHKIVI